MCSDNIEGHVTTGGALIGCLSQRQTSVMAIGHKSCLSLPQETWSISLIAQVCHLAPLFYKIHVHVTSSCAYLYSTLFFGYAVLFISDAGR